LDTKPEIQVRFADTEDFCQVYFSAYSEELNLQQLSNLTSIKPTNSYDKGDKLTYKAVASGSSIEFCPTPEPDTFANKLNELLTLLEQDVAGIRRLANEANGSIWVLLVFHNGTNMLGGLHFNTTDIQRVALLNLEIDFDLYAAGNFFKDLIK
jgi:hypothetical protein